jgi:hypothetical protein
MTLLIEEPSVVGSVAQARRRHRRKSILLIVGLVVVLSAVFVARYQPLAMNGAGGTGAPGPNGHTKFAYDTVDIKNHEPFGVTVVAIDGVQTDQYPPTSKVSATEVCPMTKKWGSVCFNYDPKAIPLGLPFHPFALNGGVTNEVLWHFTYDCRHANPSLQVKMPVTYRFLFFTRTVSLYAPAFENSC